MKFITLSESLRYLHSCTLVLHEHHLSHSVSISFPRQTKRGDSDLTKLQECMRLANEMDVVFLEDIMTSTPHFRSIREKGEGQLFLLFPFSPHPLLFVYVASLVLSN